MTKRFLSTLSILLIALLGFAEGKAKYVFYFIGDGMGVNQVNAAYRNYADKHLTRAKRKAACCFRDNKVNNSEDNGAETAEH